MINVILEDHNAVLIGFRASVSQIIIRQEPDPQEEGCSLGIVTLVEIDGTQRELFRGSVS